MTLVDKEALLVAKKFASTAKYQMRQKGQNEKNSKNYDNYKYNGDHLNHDKRPNGSDVSQIDAWMMDTIIRIKKLKISILELWD